MASRPQQVRIIGGQHRGRRLRFPPASSVRPTPDRVRETLFNWLAPVIQGAQVLDAFAGSGALGIEALSRGAARAVMLERDPRCVTAISEQLSEWRVDPTQWELHRADALEWLAGGRPANRPPFDVVFLDPPFDQALWAAAVRALEQGRWLAPTAWVYFEMPLDIPAGALPSADSRAWQAWRKGTAGEVGYHLYQYHDCRDTGT